MTETREASMGKKSRNKGIGGELEAAKVLQAHLELRHRPERILDQTRGQDNGLDIVVGRLGIQMKRHKKVSHLGADNALREATDQIMEDPVYSGLMAVAMTRGDREPWRITMWLDDVLCLMVGQGCVHLVDGLGDLTVTMTVQHWAKMIRSQEAQL
jgi:hypothetical protein